MPHNQRKQQKVPNQPLKEKTDLGLLRFKADGSQVTIQQNSAAAVYDTSGAPRHASVPTLRLDLKASKVWVGAAPPLPENSSSLTLGIVGLLRLERGSILVLVSKAKRICGMPDGPVYKVEDTALVAPETINKCENDLRHAALLQEALTPKCFGSHLFFSHTANITASRQRQADMETALPGISSRSPAPVTSADTAPRTTGGGGGGALGIPSLGSWWDDATVYGNNGGDDDGSGGGGRAGAASGSSRGRGGGGSGGGGGTLWSRADQRFVWNRELMRPLLDAGAEAFALPIMAGYVGQAAGATFTLRDPSRPPTGTTTTTTSSSAAAGGSSGGGVGGGGSLVVPSLGELTLITRLGADRPVAGSWRRGADRHGHTAGFAETEVLLTLWQPEPQGDPHPQCPQHPQQPQSGDIQQGPQQRVQAPEGRQSDDEGAAAGGGAGGVADGQGRGVLVEHGTAGAPEFVMGHAQRDGGGGDGEAVLRRRTRVAVASYVMARGSAPLYWSAPPDLRLCPAPRGPEDGELHRGPFDAHLQSLLKAYGKPVLLLNLICGANPGPQLRLHDVLQKQASAFNAKEAQRPPHADRVDVTLQRDADKAAAAAAGTAAAGGTGGVAPAIGGPVAVVGMPLAARDLSQLACCGAAAARLERECAPECRRMRAFVSVDQIELTVSPAVAAAPGNAAAGPASGPAPGGGGSLSRHVACVGRHVHCRQEGVVRVSSASTASAGGCCGEVDLAQAALALPVLAEVLVAVGALEDAADVEVAHGNVMLALAQLWCHMADVMSDQALGTGSEAGRALRSAAARLEHRGEPLGAVAEVVVRRPWRRLVATGEVISRYYYGNFTDARRQDAYDLASGAYQVSYPPAPIPRRQPPNTTSLQLAILLLLTAAIQVVTCAMWNPPSLQDAASRIGVPLAIGSLLLLNVLRLSVSYVEQPTLRPQAVSPWTEE